MSPPSQIPGVVRRQFEIKNKLGLHARAASQLIEVTRRFSSAVTVAKDGQTVDGKSIIELMMLAAGQGSIIEVSADGPDAEEALAAIAALIDDRFNESE
jgi:phosphocarrier protein HPr